MAKPVLVDTDVMVDFLRGHPKAIDLSTLNIRHYPMFKGLKPAYTKTSGSQPNAPGTT